MIFALGYDGAVIVEGTEDPSDSTTHWANYSICLNVNLTIADAQRMVDLVKEVAPVRCKLVAVDVTAADETWNGNINFDGMHAFGQVSALTGITL